MVWFRTAGYKRDPFTTERTPFLIGLAELQEELTYALHSGGMMAVEGGKGFGKTSLLNHAIETFRGRGRVIYLDAEALSKRLNIEHVLMEKYGWRGRLFGKYPKNMLLLVDNADALSSVNCERIKYFYDSNHLQSVVFTVEDYSKTPFSQSIVNRINKNVFELLPLTESYALELVRKRQHKKEIIDEATLRVLFPYCKGSAGVLLQLCSIVGKCLSEVGPEQLDASVVRQLAAEFVREVPLEDTPSCHTCTGALVDIEGQWRCTTCDTFCRECGVLVNKKEYACPKCSHLLEEDLATVVP